MAENDQKNENDQSPARELTDAEADAVSGGTRAEVDVGGLKRRVPKYSGTPPVLVPIVVS